MGTTNVEALETLRNQSIMILGHRSLVNERIRYDSFHDASNKIEEEEMRELLSQISRHINKPYIKPGSARKFFEGKLIYHERPSTDSKLNEIYCLYTKEMKITNSHKKVFKSISSRGGMYSSRRFFSELMEALDDNVEVEDFSNVSVEEAISMLDKYESEAMDFNKIGRLITYITYSGDIQPMVLENIYYIIYEIMNRIQTSDVIDEDPDELLDAAFHIANIYETYTLHLALELYKKIIPMAKQNNRYNLEVASILRICSLYLETYPDSGELMLDQLSSVDVSRLDELSKRTLESYYVLMGQAYYELRNYSDAASNYEKAIEIASINVSSPDRIAEAYSSLAAMNFSNYQFKEATRQYLTASTLSFSYGGVADSNRYLEQASLPDIYTSLTLEMAAIDYRMNGEDNVAEFKSWEGLRMLVKAYIHAMHGDMSRLSPITSQVLSYASAILDIPGKKRTNLRIIRSIRKLIDNLVSNTYAQGEETEKIDKVMTEIEKYLPLPSPIFMLLSIDGRLITMGSVENSGYQPSRLKGVILSGIISAITSLISEVGAQDSTLKHIDAGNFQILLEGGTYTITALLVDRVAPVFRSRLIAVNKYIEEEYAEVLSRWRGTLSKFDSLKEQVVANFAPMNLTKYL